MSAIEQKVGLGVVVERPYAPVVGCVAIGALAPELSLVCVILAMAINACRLCAFKFLVHMAGLTGRRGVQAREWKSREVMIEAHIRLPALFTMAGTAVGTE